MNADEIQSKVLDIMKTLSDLNIAPVDKKKIAAKLYQRYLKIEKGLANDIQQDSTKS